MALVPEKQRSMSRGETLYFRIGTKVLGQDSDGELRTTPVIEVVDPPAQSPDNVSATRRPREIDEVEDRLRTLDAGADAAPRQTGLCVKEIVDACQDVFPDKSGDALRKAVTRCLARIIAEAGGEIVKGERGGYRIVGQGRGRADEPDIPSAAMAA